MDTHAGKTASLWMDTAPRPEFLPLSGNTATDICVIGAGIAGLTTAYLLLEAGKSVVVLDDGPIISGETERTTAHLTNALDDRYFELEKSHGEEGGRLAAESHTAAIAAIERIVAAEKIACDFERLDGYLFRGGDSPPDILEQEFAATHRAGIATQRVDAPVALNGSARALRFPDQAQFHPVKYLAALANAIIQRGGRIFCHSHATSVTGGQVAEVRVENGAIVTSAAVVVATNTPINDRLAIHTKQAAYRSYVVAFNVPRGAIPRGLYWDTAEPYHYVRLQSGGGNQDDVLIVGGEDHKTGQEDDAALRYVKLEQWARQNFPAAKEVRYRWSGQVMEPVDGLGYIGRNPMDEENVLIVTGDSGNGMTHGTIGGILLTDIILGRDNPWEMLYQPGRVNLSPTAAVEFIKENANMAAQYTDWFTGGDVEREELIPPGTGAVVRHGMAKVALFRDSDGRLHGCSAVCPHLGAIVAWNHSEGTWDCPAHGSRFGKLGEVLNGPANSPLEPVDLSGREEPVMDETRLGSGP